MDGVGSVAASCFVVVAGRGWVGAGVGLGCGVRWVYQYYVVDLVAVMGWVVYYWRFASELNQSSRVSGLEEKHMGYGQLYPVDSCRPHRRPGMRGEVLRRCRHMLVLSGVNFHAFTEPHHDFLYYLDLAAPATLESMMACPGELLHARYAQQQPPALTSL